MVFHMVCCVICTGALFSASTHALGLKEASLTTDKVAKGANPREDNQLGLKKATSGKGTNSIWDIMVTNMLPRIFLFSERESKNVMHLIKYGITLYFLITYHG